MSSMNPRRTPTTSRTAQKCAPNVPHPTAAELVYSTSLASHTVNHIRKIAGHRAVPTIYDLRRPSPTAGVRDLQSPVHRFDSGRPLGVKGLISGLLLAA